MYKRQVQRQVVVIFGGSNVGQYTFRGITVGMCHYGHGSGYDTTVGEPVFRTDVYKRQEVACVRIGSFFIAS